MKLCVGPSRSSTTYDSKESLGASGGGGIAVPVVKSMSSGSWTHDNPSASWATQPHLSDSYRYSAHQRLLLSHSATCNPAGIVCLFFFVYLTVFRKFIDMCWIIQTRWYFDIRASLWMHPPATITHSNIWPWPQIWLRFKPFTIYGAAKFFTSDLVAALTSIPRPSRTYQFLCRLNYIISQSLVKFRPLLFCKMSC